MDQYQDLYIIRIDSMNSISINTSANTVTIGAGVEMGELITALFNQQRQTSKNTEHPRYIVDSFC